MILQVSMEKVIVKHGKHENYFRNYNGMSTCQ